VMGKGHCSSNQEDIAKGPAIYDDEPFSSAPLPSLPTFQRRLPATLGIHLGFRDYSSNTLPTITTDGHIWNKAVSDLHHFKPMFADDREQRGALGPRPTRKMISHNMELLV
jgi:hypothetical protein